MKIFLVFIMVLISYTIYGSNWKYYEKLTNEGSRSEGKIGILEFNGIEIPKKIGLIQTEIGCYEFKYSSYLWGFKGWQKVKNISFKISNNKFTKKERKNKFYIGAKLKNTPNNWNYIPRYKLWIESSYINEYIEEKLKFDPGIAGDITIQPVMNGLNKLKEKAWKYIINIKNKGSRSEGKIGVLKYNNKEISSKIGKLFTSKKYYEFVTSKVPWGFKGWKKCDNFDLPLNIREYYNKGMKWYKGGKRRNTPKDWCYLEKFNYWVNPDKLDEFCKEELKDIKESSANPWDAIFGN